MRETLQAMVAFAKAGHDQRRLRVRLRVTGLPPRPSARHSSLHWETRMVDTSRGFWQLASARRVGT